MAPATGGGFADRRGGEHEVIGTPMDFVEVESGEMGKEGGDSHDV